MEFQDKTLICEDCQAEFIHSADDQQRYAERGFTNEPKRCRPCREQRKRTMDKGRRPGGGGPRRGGPGGGSSGHGGGGPRRPRQLFDAVCSACGKQTQVPFQPTEGRPVFCRDCYKPKDAQGSSHESAHGSMRNEPGPSSEPESSFDEFL